jgi:uncharacterized phage protein gp47/JayE
MDGNIPLENLDDRSWQDLVDQAKTLAQQYAPQWTDLGPSDPGMALIELFAWLVEGMQYRLNRVPDRSYAAMLNLVGVTRDPARPAVTMLTFTPVIPPLPGNPPKIAAGTTISTTATEKQSPIPFQTDDDLIVLPSNLVWAFKLVSADLPQNLTTNLIRSPLSGHTLPMQSSDTAQFLFGFDTPLATSFAMNIRIAGPPLLPVEASKWLALKWGYSVAGASPFTATANVVDGTNNLQQSGTVQFPVLGNWAKRTLKEVSGANFSDNDPNASISAFWLSLTVTAPAPTGPTRTNFRVNLAHVLFNSVSATNLVTVPPDKPEVLASPSTGLPWQQYQLQFAPLYKIPGVRDPYGHVQISVDEPQSGGGTANPTYVNHAYAVVDEFPKGADAMMRCCRLAPVTGTVLFGSNDGTTQLTGAGLIPPKGSKIKASYRAVAGGANGNVPPGVLVLFSPPTGVQSVTNPGPGRGGEDQESVEEAKRRAPDLLRIRSRAVTLNDYKYLALEASTLVKKASALGASALDASDTGARKSLDGRGGFSRVPGKVTVLIVPDYPRDNPRPTPDPDLINEVRAYLDDRRVVTTALLVGSPRFLPITVTAAVSLFPTATPAPAFSTELQARLRAAATAYLHPLYGGADGDGWDIGEDLFASGLFARLQSVIGDAGFISQLTVKPGLEATREQGDSVLAKPLDPAVGVGLLDFEMICSAATHFFVTQPL